MPKKPSFQQRNFHRHRRAACEYVHFAEVEFARPVVPRLVVQISDGLSTLIEDQSAVSLTAQFIAELRNIENPIDLAIEQNSND